MIKQTNLKVIQLSFYRNRHFNTLTNHFNWNWWGVQKILTVQLDACGKLTDAIG